MARVRDLSTLPQLQRDAINNIMARVRQMGSPPEGASCSGALSALRAAGSSYCEPEPSVGEVVPMSISELSLPQGKTAGVELESALTGPVRDMVVDFENHMLQDSSAWTALEDEAAKVPPYNDKMLQDRDGYLIFIKHLFKCGVLDFTSCCRGRVGAFTVSKKPKIVDGKKISRQRLVLDCRQINLLFKPPPLTELGSLAALKNIHLKSDQQLWTAGADIRDCFYAVNCVPGMMDFFCLSQDISFSEASWATDGVISSKFESGRICPCIKVLPMGFNWSFYIIQAIHEQAVLQSLNIPRHSLVLEGHPPPQLVDDTCISMPYCDNVHTMALTSEVCQEGCDKISSHLRELGFELHEEESASLTFPTLGGLVDGSLGQIRPTHNRMWRISLAFEYLTRSVVSPLLVQRLLGHAMTMLVLNRAGMSVFRRLYDFVDKAVGPRRLNRDECNECWVFIGIIPMLIGDMRREWSDTITATDASPSGFGVCERCTTTGAAHELGKWSERWRFRRLPPEMWAPRKRATGKDVFTDLSTVVGDSEVWDDVLNYTHNEDFPEVDSALLQPGDWHTVKMGKWNFTDESITIKEGRALVIALRRLARTSRHRNKNHVFLIDNLSLCFATCKGRGHSFPLLRILQQVGSICLAANIGVFPRWIPSEWNVADGPSRGQILPGPFKKVCEQFETSTGGASDRGGQEANLEEHLTEFDESRQGSHQEQSFQERFKDCNLSRDGQEKDASSEKIYSQDASSGNGECRQVGPSEEVDCVGEKERISRDQSSISGLLREVQGLLLGERSKLAGVSRGRRSDTRRFPRYTIPGRPKPRRRGEDHCSSRISTDRPEEQISAEQACTQGLAKNHAGSQPLTTAKVSFEGHRDGSTEPGLPRHVSPLLGCFRSLPSTRRSHRVKVQERGGPSEESRSSIPMGDGHHSGGGGIETGQDRDLRQFTPDRSARASLVRHGFVTKSKRLQFKGRRVVGLFDGSIQERVHQVGKQPRLGKPASISNEARGCYRGPHSEVPRPQRSESKGTLADRCQREEIRKGGESSTAPQQNDRVQHSFLPMVGTEPRSGFSGGDTTSISNDVSRVDVLTLTRRPHKFALEIFAGSARLSQSVAKAGITMFPIDISLFGSHNILLPSVERKIQNWMREGRITMIWFGMPCTTFSRARKNDGVGPGPLRTPEQLWGLSTLSRHDYAKLQDGNLLFHALIRFLQLCVSLCIPFVVENPLSSMLWMMPPLFPFFNNKLTTVVDLDYCAYGEQWKKPTRLLCYNINLSPMANRCSGPFSKCCFTNQPHVALTGRNHENVFMTLVAQPYPWSFCASFAELLKHHLENFRNAFGQSTRG